MRACMQPRSLYTSSPTADRAASQGIGGQQGLLFLAACLAAVAVATLGVGRETTQQQSLSQATIPGPPLLPGSANLRCDMAHRP